MDWPKITVDIITAFIKIMIFSVLVMFLWNGFMDVKFGLPMISWLDSMVICLIGSFITQV